MATLICKRIEGGLAALGFLVNVDTERPGQRSERVFQIFLWAGFSDSFDEATAVTDTVTFERIHGDDALIVLYGGEKYLRKSPHFVPLVNLDSGANRP